MIIHYFVFDESSQIECCCWRCCRCIKQSERKCEMDGVLYNSLPEKRKQKLLQIICFWFFFNVKKGEGKCEMGSAV